MARPADDQRDPQAALVAGPLAAEHVGSVVADVDHERVGRFARPLEFGQQIAHERVEPHHAVVVVSNRFADAGRVDTKIRERLHVIRIERIGGQAIDLPQPRPVGVGVVDAEEERAAVRREELRGVAGVIGQVLPCEVAVGDPAEVEGEGRLGIDVELADQPGAVAGILEAAGQVGRVVAKHAEPPGGKAHLTVLVGIEAGQETRSRRAAAGLGYERPLEANSVSGELVELRRAGVRIAVAAQLRPVVFRHDQEDVGPLCSQSEGRDRRHHHCQEQPAVASRSSNSPKTLLAHPHHY